MDFLTQSDGQVAEQHDFGEGAGSGEIGERLIGLSCENGIEPFLVLIFYSRNVLGNVRRGCHDSIGLDQPVGVSAIEKQGSFAADQDGSVFGNILTLYDFCGRVMLIAIFFTIIPNQLYRRVLPSFGELVSHA